MKPDDISQEAWDAAEVIAKEATRHAMRDPLMPYFITVRPYIARAIDTAKSEAADLIATLTAERNRAIADLFSFGELYDAEDKKAADEIAGLQTALSTALLQVEALTKALEPFARAADDAERLAGHDGPLGQYVGLTELRAARESLRSLSKLTSSAPEMGGDFDRCS